MLELVNMMLNVDGGNLWCNSIFLIYKCIDVKHLVKTLFLALSKDIFKKIDEQERLPKVFV